MSWTAAQNVDVVLNFVGRGMTPALCILSAGLSLKARSTPAVAYMLGDQEEALTRVIGRWRVILKRLTPAQKSTLERVDPGVVERLLHRLDELEGQVVTLGAHAETAPWLQRIYPWSELAGHWGHMAEEVNKANEDLKRTTALAGMDIVRVIQEAEAAADDLSRSASQTPTTVLDIAASPSPLPQQSEGTLQDEMTQGASLSIPPRLVLARNLPPLSNEMMRMFNEAFLSTTALMRPFLTRSQGRGLSTDMSFDMV